MAEKKTIKETIKETANSVAEKADGVGSKIVEKTIDLAQNAGSLAVNAKDTVIAKLDVNGDGEVGIDDIIVQAIKLPGVHVTRASFLQKELFKNHPQEVIDKAISTTPAKAGISAEEINKIADEVIKFERNCVSGISVVLGAPGGWAMAATIPADIVQYYGYTFRATQKLLYLYGFPEIDTDEEGLMLDSETINAIVICLGVMNGVAGANNAIKAMAKALATGVEKKLLNMALTKGAVYPLVKSILKWFGIKLTKSLFAGAVKKAIPIVGGVVGGGITFLSFKPCCCRLKDVLSDTMLSNPEHVSTVEEDEIVESIISGKVIDCEILEETNEGSSGRE